MNAPLSRFLVEFTAETAVGADLESIAFDPVDPADEEPMVVLTADAFQRALREARDEAAAAASADAEAGTLSRLETERADLEGGFAREREAWASEQGARIGASLTAAFAQLEAELSAALTEALRPLFVERSRERIFAQLAAALDSILGDPAHPPVRIEGPADLLTAFGAAQASDLAVDYVVREDAAELTLITDATRIETRLRACLATLS